MLTGPSASGKTTTANKLAAAPAQPELPLAGGEPGQFLQKPRRLPPACRTAARITRTSPPWILPKLSAAFRAAGNGGKPTCRVRFRDRDGRAETTPPVAARRGVHCGGHPRPEPPSLPAACPGAAFTKIYAGSRGYSYRGCGHPHYRTSALRAYDVGLQVRRGHSLEKRRPCGAGCMGETSSSRCSRPRPIFCWIPRSVRDQPAGALLACRWRAACPNAPPV